MYQKLYENDDTVTRLEHCGIDRGANENTKEDIYNLSTGTIDCP